MAKVLLIEDYDSLREVYTTILKDAGHEVLIAKNGEEGLEQAKSNKVDLILLDILMPKEGGFEFLEKYDMKSHQNVKLIILTNVTSVDFINKALALGANNYLVKAEITPEKMMDVINETLGESSPKHKK